MVARPAAAPPATDATNRNTSPGRPGAIMNLTQRILTAKARLKIQLIDEEIGLLRYEIMCTKPGSQAHNAMLDTITREMTYRSHEAAVCERHGIAAQPMQVDEMMLWGAVAAALVSLACVAVPAALRATIGVLS